jgi:RNA polymerase sigma-70 factor (ECF subfamily)
LTYSTLTNPAQAPAAQKLGMGARPGRRQDRQGQEKPAQSHFSRLSDAHYSAATFKLGFRLWRYFVSRMEETRTPGVKHPDMDGSAEDIRGQMVRLLPRLRRFAAALTGSVADGDDLVQDTVERALKSLHQWEPGTRLDSWMFRIAKNRFIDTRRSHKRSGVVASEVPEDAPSVTGDGARAADARLMLADAMDALQKLPPEQREALVLVTIDGLSYRDAADILQIPIGTLTSRIARARETLAPLAPEG